MVYMWRCITLALQFSILVRKRSLIYCSSRFFLFCCWLIKCDPTSGCFVYLLLQEIFHILCDACATWNGCVWGALRKMSPEVGQILVAVALFLSSDAIRIDTISHGHQSRRSGGTDVFSSPFLAEHRVTNITTQIGTHAYLPCKVIKWINCQWFLTWVVYFAILFLCAMILEFGYSLGETVGQQISVMGTSSRRSHFNGGPHSVYRRWPLPILLRWGHRHVDTAAEICASSWCWNLWMSGVYRAEGQRPGPFTRSRWVMFYSLHFPCPFLLLYNFQPIWFHFSTLVQK